MDGRAGKWAIVRTRKHTFASAALRSTSRREACSALALRVASAASTRFSSVEYLGRGTPMKTRAHEHVHRTHE